MTVDLTSHLKTCRRSHPHEEMDDACERYTEYERELASLRAEKERAEAERDEAIRMRDRHAEASKAQNEDITALMAERDAALKDADDRLRKMLATQAAHVRDNSNRLEVFAGMQDEARYRRLAASYLDELSVCIDLDAAIDAARKGGR